MKRPKFITLIAFLPVLLACLVFPAHFGGAMDKDREIRPADIAESVKAVETLYPASTQAIIVSGTEASGLDARLFAFEKHENEWKKIMGPIEVVIGRKGLAPSGAKREGDGKTPRGVYPLGLAFGYGPKIDSAMPYRRMTPDDIWVDDPVSPDYNRLKRRGETRAGSFEDMVLPDNRYKYGIVIEYNTDPVIPGYGSAIFLHVWKDVKTPTSGCIAVSETDILKLLRWLDPAKKPVIVSGKP